MDHQDEGREPLVVAFVDDLMSMTRIVAVASHLGYRLETIGQANVLEAGLRDSGIPHSTIRLPGTAIYGTLSPASTQGQTKGPAGRPGEPVEGPMASMIDHLTAWQPALLIFDLANHSIPWRDWLAVLKSSPATRRMPVICYGPHVDKVSLADAAMLITETDAVVARSRFFSAMPELISNTARQHDLEGIKESCRSPLSDDALRGLEAFNSARYFEAHEHLEDAWNADPGAAKELYRAVLQVAVAYLQIERRNYRGAIKMFLRARQWLAPLPDSCRTIDVARLRADAEKVYRSLVHLGPDEIDRFDLGSLPPVRFATSGRSAAKVP